MKKKTGIFLIIGIVLALMLTGCGKQSVETETAHTTEEDKLQIGLSFDSFVIERWLRDRDMFVSTAQSLGAEVNVQVAGGEVEEQISQIEYFIQKKMDVIIIIPIDGDALYDVVKEAKSKGICVICYDRIIPNVNADLYITIDNEMVGTLMGEALKKACPDGGNIFAIYGSPTDKNVEEVEKGFKDALVDSKLNIVYSGYCDNWLAEIAETHVNKGLEVTDDIVGVMCGNDDLASQVVKVLSENRLAGQVAVVAQDAELAACQRIVEGTQTMTVYKPIEQEASTAATLAVMLGIVYAGCFYVPVNPMNPAERLRKIMEKLEPEVIISDEKGKEQLAVVGVGLEEKVIGPETLLPTTGTDLSEEQRSKLEQIQGQWKETDALYGIFTSGSTGTPKAIVVSHGAVSRFVRHFTEIFEITSEDVIGNQAPFDFDVSVKDIYSSIMTGAQLVLIPKEYFSTPPRLLDYLCDKKVTNLTWAVSALTLVSALKGLNYRVPESVKRVMFSGEAMPPKQLRIWQEKLPEAKFVNLYGPTEITCNCTYFPIERQYEDSEKIPAGKAFPGRRVILVDEEGKQVTEPGVQGEICSAGESLANGYYKEPEQTAEKFVLYPVDGTEQRMYRTGDLGSYDEEGNIVFAGRKDFQIKHMGHRIELEEIERSMTALDGVEKSCCVFDMERNRIMGFYLGEKAASDVRKQMKEKLPVYMVPTKLIQVDEMPLNKNGKTDRNYFKNYGKK